MVPPQEQEFTRLEGELLLDDYSPDSEMEELTSRNRPSLQRDLAGLQVKNERLIRKIVFSRFLC